MSNKLNFTQRRGGMMATVYIPVSLTKEELEMLKRLAKDQYGSVTKWRTVLERGFDTAMSSAYADYADLDGVV